MQFRLNVPDEAEETPSNVFAMATPHHLLLKLHWEITQLRASMEGERRLVDTHAPADDLRDLPRLNLKRRP
jgi:hypothetical protein